MTIPMRPRIVLATLLLATTALAGPSFDEPLLPPREPPLPPVPPPPEPRNLDDLARLHGEPVVFPSRSGRFADRYDRELAIASSGYAQSPRGVFWLVCGVSAERDDGPRRGLEDVAQQSELFVGDFSRGWTWRNSVVVNVVPPRQDVHLRFFARPSQQPFRFVLYGWAVPEGEWKRLWHEVNKPEAST